MKAHMENALAIARFLEKHEKIDKVTSFQDTKTMFRLCILY